MDERAIVMLGRLDSNSEKMRVGFLCLIVGIVMVFWAWGSWIYRASVPVQAEALVRAQTGGEGEDGQGHAVEDRAKVARAVWLFIIVGAGLVLLVLFGTYAIVRAARRFRATAEKGAKEQTDERDVWSMHRLSQDDEEMPVS